LTKNILETIKEHTNKRIGVLVFKTEILNDDISTQIVLSKIGDMTDAASKLYDALHQLDKLNLDVIIAEKFPDYELGKSINDRLERATK